MVTSQRVLNVSWLFCIFLSCVFFRVHHSSVPGPKPWTQFRLKLPAGSGDGAKLSAPGGLIYPDVQGQWLIFFQAINDEREMFAPLSESIRMCLSEISKFSFQFHYALVLLLSRLLFPTLAGSRPPATDLPCKYVPGRSFSASFLSFFYLLDIPYVQDFNIAASYGTSFFYYHWVKRRESHGQRGE